MAEQWCKIAASLDSHPKIRRAGRLGREVFLFALRRNAMAENPVPGTLPAAVMEPWFVADQLMMTEAEAVEGIASAIRAGLLAPAATSCTSSAGQLVELVIAGWDEGWSKGDSHAGRVAGGRSRAASASRKNGRFAPADQLVPAELDQQKPAHQLRSDQIRSDLPERETTPSRPPAAPAAADPDQSRRQEIRREIWRELEAARMAVACELGQAYQLLPAFDPGERDLAMRLQPDLDAGAAVARHAIAVAREEAITKRSLEWFSGVIFGDRQMRRAAGMDPAKMRAARTAAAPRRVQRLADRPDDDSPPIPSWQRESAGAKP